MKKYLTVTIALLAGGCASYTSLNDGHTNRRGGGFQDWEVAPGLFYLVARTNWSPWENLSGARQTFKRRAQELCGTDHYITIQMTEFSFEPFRITGVTLPPYIESQVEAYVLSSRSKLTEADAREFIKTKPAQLNPVTEETRIVKKVANADKVIRVTESMVWYDVGPTTKGLRFPPSDYVLEAEDSDYWYLRSNEPIELASFRHNRLLDNQKVSGGIMLGKSLTLGVVAGGYIDGKEGSKVMVWKLGKDFLNREGNGWKKNF